MSMLYIPEPRTPCNSSFGDVHVESLRGVEVGELVNEFEFSDKLYASSSTLIEDKFVAAINIYMRYCALPWLTPLLNC